MLNVSFAQKTENLSSFGNESDIQTLILLDNFPENLFSDENNIDKALDMYSKSAISQNITDTNQLLVDEIYNREYNEQALIKVLRFISNYSDEYNDLIKFIHAIIQKININSEIEFALNLSKFTESEIISYVNKHYTEPDDESADSVNDKEETPKDFKDYNAIIHED